MQIMSSHLDRQESKRLQVEFIPLDPKMCADYNQGMTINIYIKYVMSMFLQLFYHTLQLIRLKSSMCVF